MQSYETKVKDIHSDFYQKLGFKKDEIDVFIKLNVDTTLTSGYNFEILGCDFNPTIHSDYIDLGLNTIEVKIYLKSNEFIDSIKNALGSRQSINEFNQLLIQNNLKQLEQIKDEDLWIKDYFEFFIDLEKLKDIKLNQPLMLDHNDIELEMFNYNMIAKDITSHQIYGIDNLNVINPNFYNYYNMLSKPYYSIEKDNAHINQSVQIKIVKRP